MSKAPTDPDTVLAVVLPLGGVLTLVGALDTALLWWPLRFGNAEWEFATIGATFNSLPLPTLGMGLLSAAAIARHIRWLARLAGAVAIVVCLALVAASLLYLLILPIAWQGTAPAAQQILQKVILKTSVYAMLYIGLFAWLARVIWRNMKIMEGRTRRSAGVITPLEVFSQPANQQLEPSSDL